MGSGAAHAKLVHLDMRDWRGRNDTEAVVDDHAVARTDDTEVRTPSFSSAKLAVF